MTLLSMALAFGAGVGITLLGLYFAWCRKVWDQRNSYWLEGFTEGQHAERAWWTNQGKQLRRAEEADE